MKPTVKFLGTAVLIQKAQMLTVKARQTAEAELKKAGFKIANDAKRYCPVKTGRLRSSLTVNWTGSGMARGTSGGVDKPHNADDAVGQPTTSEGKGFLVVVGTNVLYSEPVHDRIPYLLAAFRDAEAGAFRDLERAMAKVI